MSSITSYEQACADHRWEVPERYNIAADVCDRHPREKLAMIHEDFQRQRPRGELGRAAGHLQPVRQRARRATACSAATGWRCCCRRRPRPRRRSSGPGRRRDPALDVGALRRRGDPPPAHRLPGQGAGHQRGQRRPDGALARRARADPRRRAARATARPRSTRVDTAADDPAQLYYSSGTTGLAKGILHAHRYILAHEEFVYCHDVQDGELLPRHGGVGLGGGDRSAARALALRRRAGRLPARGRL